MVAGRGQPWFKTCSYAVKRFVRGRKALTSMKWSYLGNVHDFFMGHALVLSSPQPAVFFESREFELLRRYPCLQKQITEML